MSTFQKSSFEFISNLEKNNNREWFTLNRPQYEKELKKVVLFADSVLEEMTKHDKIETESGKKSLHRIYRDIRFSKDKTPYKNHWSMSFIRATKLLRGSYYVHLEPGNVFIGAGFWGPEKDDLLRIRQQISMFGDELTAILNQKDFVKNFGTLKGEKLKNGPKDFDKEDPYIDLLKFKQFLVAKSFTDEEVFSPNFSKEISDTLKIARPFLDFMSEALTTDVNGESLNLIEL